MKKKIILKHHPTLPISAIFWQYFETDVSKIEKEEFSSIHYNTSKLKGRPFYKSISKIIDFK